MGADEVFAELDRVIAQSASEDRPGLIVSLAARLAQLGAGLAVPPSATAELGAEALDHNLSAKETARRLGLSLPYLYKHANEYPFAMSIGRRRLFSARGLEAWLRAKRTA